MLSNRLTLFTRVLVLGEDIVMTKNYPDEFNRDVVTVARRGDLSVVQFAIDFGVAKEIVRR